MAQNKLVGSVWCFLFLNSQLYRHLNSMKKISQRVSYTGYNWRMKHKYSFVCVSVCGFSPKIKKWKRFRGKNGNWSGHQKQHFLKKIARLVLFIFLGKYWQDLQYRHVLTGPFSHAKKRVLSVLILFSDFPIDQLKFWLQWNVGMFWLLFPFFLCIHGQWKACGMLFLLVSIFSSTDST